MSIHPLEKIDDTLSPPLISQREEHGDISGSAEDDCVQQRQQQQQQQPITAHLVLPPQSTVSSGRDAAAAPNAGVEAEADADADAEADAAVTTTAEAATATVVDAVAVKEVVGAEAEWCISAQSFGIALHHLPTLAPAGYWDVFEGQRVHGIKCLYHSTTGFRSGRDGGGDLEEYELVCWGGRLVCFVRLRVGGLGVGRELEVVGGAVECVDWVLDVCALPALVSDALDEGADSIDGRCNAAVAVAVTAHSDLIALSYGSPAMSEESKTGVRLLSRGSRSILYAAHLLWKDETTLLVAGGTAFGQIIVQSCVFDAPSATSDLVQKEICTHYVFSGHEGSIFGIRLSEPLKRSDGSMMRVLASCSDDRSVSLWDVSDLSSHANSTIVVGEGESTGFSGIGIKHHLASGVGHVSRVWSLRFVHSRARLTAIVRLVSAGEDATCRAWDLVPAKDQTAFELKSAGVLCAHSGKNVWAMEVFSSRSDSGQQVLLSGGADGGILVTTIPAAILEPTSWSLDTIKSIATVSGPSGKDCFRALALSSDGAILMATDQGHVLLSQPQIPANSTSSSDGWTCIDTLPALRGYSIAASANDCGFAAFAGSSGQVYCFDPSSKSMALVHSAQRKVSGLWLDVCDLAGSKSLVLLVAELGKQALTVVHIDLSQNETRPEAPMEVEIGSGVVTAATSYYTADSQIYAVGSRNGTCRVYKIPHQETGAVSHHFDLDGAGKESITQLKLVEHDEQMFLITAGRDGFLTIYSIPKRSNGRCHVLHRLAVPFGPHIEGFIICALTQDLIVYGFHSTSLVIYNVTQQREVGAVSCGGAHRTFALQSCLRLADNDKIARSFNFAWVKLHQLRRQEVHDTATKVVQQGGHGRDIKTCVVSPVDFTVRGQLSRLIASGAEDTDIKIFTRTKTGFQCLATIQKHGTGVRCLKWSQDGTRLFSSGGKEEFFVWRVVEAPIVQIGVVCEAVLPVKDGGSDLRIISFDVKSERNDASAEATYIITLAFSNSFVKTFEYKYDGVKSTWNLLASTQYTTACLTHIEYLDMQSHRIPNFVTTSTDGRLVLWQTLTDNQHEFVASKQLHQSTISSCAALRLGQKDWLFVTGGDDNALCFVRYLQPDSSFRALRIPKAHAAAVTGIQLHDEQLNEIKIISVGLDQRVKQWTYSVQDHAVCKSKSWWTSIADPAGLNDVIYGVGLQRLQGLQASYGTL